jgi:polyisoprenoid-binding protein YceI
MKKIKLILVFLLSSVFMIINGCTKSDKEIMINSGNKSAEMKNASKILNIDKSNSKLNWAGKKVTGQHTGYISIAKGEIGMNKDKIVAGNFDIDLRTIIDVDLTDKEWNDKLINHLKSEDFFFAEKYQYAKFEISKIEPLSDNAKPGPNSMVTGNLTIKGITKGISFPAMIKIENGILNAIADFDIDRTVYDIKFRSGKFYENLGDNLIYDDFNINFNIYAK